MQERAQAPAPLVLGLDIGTGSCKASVVDGEGRLLASASAAQPTYTPHPGWSEQDPRDWLPTLARATGDALARIGVEGAAVAAIAFSTASHIGVLLDEAGEPIRRALLWNDQRSAAEIETLEREHGELIFASTLQRVSTTWTLPHLLWIRKHDPEAWRRVRRFALSKDFVIYQLTGSLATDPATALSTQLWDVGASRWAEALCALADTRPADWPPVLSPTAVVGRLTGEAARLLGLVPGTPVINGTLDSAAETLGAGLDRPGDCLIRLATAGGLHLVLPQPHPHPRLITYPHPVTPLWFSQAGTSSCASAVRWARDTFSGPRGLSYQEWDALAAATPPGAEGLYFHPYLSGERCPYWDPSLRASFVGASGHHQAGHFARAVYEGTAYSIRDALSVLDSLGTAYNGFTVVGGGTASAVWLQVLADCLGRALAVAPESDSSYGAAMLALVGLGRYPDTRAAAAAARTATRRHVVQPNPAVAAIYERGFAAYRDLHDRLAPFYQARSR